MVLSENFVFLLPVCLKLLCTHCKLRYLNPSVQCVASSRTSMLHSLARLSTGLCLMRGPALFRCRCRHRAHSTSCFVHMLSTSGKFSFKRDGMISMNFILAKAISRNASQRLSYSAISLCGSTLSLMEYTRAMRLISVQ